MAENAPPPPRRRRPITQRKVTVVDWIMLALALLSIAMLTYETWGDPTPEQTRQIIIGDLVIVGIFAIEFSIRWAKDPKPKTFPLRQWYELLGMIPIAHPAVRGFRLFRVVRIVVLLSRFGRAADRAMGEEFTYRLVAKFKGIFVELLSDAITVRILDRTMDVLQKGRYTQNMADAIEQRGDEVLEIIVEKVQQDPKVGRIRHMPFFEDVVATSSRVTQRILVDLLRDERMEQMVKQIIAQNVEQIRAEVRRNEALHARMDHPRAEAPP